MIHLMRRRFRQGKLQLQWKEIGYVPRRDADAVYKSFRAACDRLFAKRDQLGGVLYRQLVKTLPHLGAAGAELQDARAAPEGLQWLLDCALTLDIREQIHSRASPANLTLVRAYLRYLEQGDPSGLQALWLAQIPEHDRKLNAAADPAALKQKLIAYTREVEAILTRIYAFDPESPESVLANVTLWLSAAGSHAPPEAEAIIPSRKMATPSSSPI